MSNDIRTALATRLLTTKLPDGDIAAEMLLSANIEEPVKMATPPNPARCQSLIRGNFVKAATLAKSTDDPETLDKLAKHASLGVKLAVVLNPAASDTARRIVEVAALKRSDDEILQGVLKGADLSYILSGLRDDVRRSRYIRALSHSNLLVEKLTCLENPVDPEIFEEILVCDPINLAAIIGNSIGRIWPIDVEYGKLADICKTADIDTEIKFLSALAGSTNHFDATMVSVVDRLLVCHEVRWPNNAHLRDSGSLNGHAATSTMSPEGREGLIGLCRATAVLAYTMDPKKDTLEQIAARYGESVALDISLRHSGNPKVEQGAIDWIIERVRTRDENGLLTVSCDMNAVQSFIASIKDDETLVAALRRAPRNLTTVYLSGQYGDLDEHKARLVAGVYPVEVLRSVRYIFGKPWGPAAVNQAIEDAGLAEVLNNFHYLSSHISHETTELILNRMRHGGDDGQMYGLSYNRGVSDAFASDDFVGYMDRSDLPGDVLLDWLSLARKPELTFKYLKGEMVRKFSDDEFDKFVSNPGEAFGTMLGAALPRVLADLLKTLPIESVDKIVDAAGQAVVEYLRRNDDQRFCAYLSDRIVRSGASSSEWITAFELFSKSPASIGAAIGAAKRLGRARQQ